MDNTLIIVSFLGECVSSGKIKMKVKYAKLIQIGIFGILHNKKCLEIAKNQCEHVMVLKPQDSSVSNKDQFKKEG